MQLIPVVKNYVALADRNGERGKVTATDLLLVIPASSGQASGARAGIQNLDPGLRRGDGFVLTNRSELLATSMMKAGQKNADRVPSAEPLGALFALTQRKLTTCEFY